MLLLEGFVLVTLAVAVGCLIYWNYAMMDGLAAGSTTERYVGLYWTDNFSVHFAVISLVVCASRASRLQRLCATSSAAMRVTVPMLRCNNAYVTL